MSDGGSVYPSGCREGWQQGIDGVHRQVTYPATPGMSAYLADVIVRKLTLVQVWLLTEQLEKGGDYR